VVVLAAFFTPREAWNARAEDLGTSKKTKTNDRRFRVGWIGGAEQMNAEKVELLNLDANLVVFSNNARLLVGRFLAQMLRVLSVGSPVWLRTISSRRCAPEILTFMMVLALTILDF
jgi:hypothetical protein